MINIAILGYGTVGSGVYEVITRNRAIVNEKAGEEINIKYVLDLRDFPGMPVQKVITHNFDDILKDDSVRVVVEVMGGIEPAYTFVKNALLKGKHVATSNKALVAAHGPELLRIARDKNINFLFEASVGGGIPIIRPFNSSLTADSIEEVTGILNGTTNYILTEMAQKGKDFSEVLKDAQDLGYAEKDPTADVEGHDACRKIAILTSLAHGKTVNYEDIYTEGITKITDRDILYAEKMDSSIKLIGTSKSLPEGVYARVAPVILPKTHPLCNVNGVFNAIFVKGNVLGDVMFYGSGAGSLPTASAVVSDIVDAVRHMDTNIRILWSEDKLEILPIQNAPVKALIRIASKKTEEAKKAAEDIFGAVQFLSLDGIEDEFALICAEETEESLKEKMERMEENAAVDEIRNMVRMEG